MTDGILIKLLWSAKSSGDAPFPNGKKESRPKGRVKGNSNALAKDASRRKSAAATEVFMMRKGGDYDRMTGTQTVRNNNILIYTESAIGG